MPLIVRLPTLANAPRSLDTLSRGIQATAVVDAICTREIFGRRAEGHKMKYVGGSRRAGQHVSLPDEQVQAVDHNKAEAGSARTQL